MVQKRPPPLWRMSKQQQNFFRGLPLLTLWMNPCLGQLQLRSDLFFNRFMIPDLNQIFFTNGDRNKETQEEEHPLVRIVMKCNLIPSSKIALLAKFPKLSVRIAWHWKLIYFVRTCLLWVDFSVSSFIDITWPDL